MKKVLLFLLFFVSAITFSDTLKNISYSNGKVIGTFRENNQIKPNASVTKLGNEDILMLSFPNSEMESSVQAFINQNDQYISKVYTTQSNGMVVVYVYLKPSVTYQVVSRTGEFQVTLGGGQTASRNNSSQTSRYTTTQRQSTTNTQTAQTQKQPNTSTGNKKYTIVVDAGHGGHDSGARGNGYNEKDIALQVATRLANNLRRDYNVIMTRDSDFFVPLDTRAKIGNDANADFFISIHLNSSSSSSANGTEVFYFSKKDQGSYAAQVAKFENRVDGSYGDVPFSDFILNDIFYRKNQKTSQAIAESVLDGLINLTGLRRRGVFGANFAVLRGSNSPSILVELGFMNNYSDLSHYLTPEGQESAASTIGNAIRKFFK
ncbi:MULTISPECIES: N-acetylmuramoyl-L-alanine amidase [unclassified Leptotrichia]|jgi:N-acetylmuramoyl-L-alanine amidase|uniref:N-acetylmuramoyl-L-alanine amidase family protein n=1 Tax=unclassified Leptotrichia TaxID=2633022 RepID=UPI0003AE0044|nr:MULTISPECIES: N-acetylmuramoyl-L-alanine amidase [unclassified Leptotrichia]ERL25927.1 N-acetylmuramoyl-L-alanine amidase [Leptotrichia sp. oral taxon 225 str. F0581]WLD74314.1 N-acetylmuramoyl-L-alanine amidase [Leptotrichia sp. HMT-225]